MSDDRSQVGGSAGPWIVVALLALPVYVFSTGPFVWLHEHGYLPREVLLVYLPLDYLCRYVPIVQAFFIWYLDFWR